MFLRLINDSSIRNIFLGDDDEFGCGVIAKYTQTRDGMKSIFFFLVPPFNLHTVEYRRMNERNGKKDEHYSDIPQLLAWKING